MQLNGGIIQRGAVSGSDCANIFLLNIITCRKTIILCSSAHTTHLLTNKTEECHLQCQYDTLLHILLQKLKNSYLTSITKYLPNTKAQTWSQVVTGFQNEKQQYYNLMQGPGIMFGNKSLKYHIYPTIRPHIPFSLQENTDIHINQVSVSLTVFKYNILELKNHLS